MNQIPGPGFKIHYPVPNPGNWCPFFALITDEIDENIVTCSQGRLSPLGTLRNPPYTASNVNRPSPSTPTRTHSTKL